MPGVRFLSLFLLLFLLPDEIVSIFWTGAGLAERESEGEGEVVGRGGNSCSWPMVPSDGIPVARQLRG